ncbi:hypothetical protein FB451DRAFT_1170514 [Mycena latifolia]|nr:hypothetical protein FB451DRAFT_1170514 [Mycena latifolia]
MDISLANGLVGAQSQTQLDLLGSDSVSGNGIDYSASAIPGPDSVPELDADIKRGQPLLCTIDKIDIIPGRVPASGAASPLSYLSVIAYSYEWIRAVVYGNLQAGSGCVGVDPDFGGVIGNAEKYSGPCRAAGYRDDPSAEYPGSHVAEIPDSSLPPQGAPAWSPLGIFLRFPTTLAADGTLGQQPPSRASSTYITASSSLQSGSLGTIYLTSAIGKELGSIHTQPMKAVSEASTIPSLTLVHHAPNSSDFNHDKELTHRQIHLLLAYTIGRGPACWNLFWQKLHLFKKSPNESEASNLLPV